MGRPRNLRPQLRRDSLGSPRPEHRGLSIFQGAIPGLPHTAAI